MLCYCGSGKQYTDCCQPYLTKQKMVSDCETLMRSRYSAYCVKDISYLFNTWHHSKQPDNQPEQIADFANNVHFTGLQILQSQQEKERGVVCFSANYIYLNTFSQIKEESFFIQENGQWYYLHGNLSAVPDKKIGRNELCPCGSQKKFKACHQHILSGQLNG